MNLLKKSPYLLYRFHVKHAEPIRYTIGRDLTEAVQRGSDKARAIGSPIVGKFFERGYLDLRGLVTLLNANPAALTMAEMKTAFAPLVDAWIEENPTYQAHMAEKKAKAERRKAEIKKLWDAVTLLQLRNRQTRLDNLIPPGRF